MTEKSAIEQFEELHKSIIDLFLVICEELKIDQIVEYLENLLDDR